MEIKNSNNNWYKYQFNNLVWQSYGIALSSAHCLDYNNYLYSSL